MDALPARWLHLFAVAPEMLRCTLKPHETSPEVPPEMIRKCPTFRNVPALLVMHNVSQEVDPGTAGAAGAAGAEHFWACSQHLGEKEEAQAAQHLF